MTDQSTVADDVLGKVTRKVLELYRRVLQGSVNLKRVHKILQMALEAPPKPNYEGSSWGSYILECEWSWDNTHREYATIGLEKCDSEIPFEQLLDPSTSDYQRENLLEMLNRVYDAQVPRHGSRCKLRFYRVLTRGFGFHPLDRESIPSEVGVLDVNLVLKPLFDFNDQGNPIPCKQ